MRLKETDEVKLICPLTNPTAETGDCCATDKPDDDSTALKEIVVGDTDKPDLKHLAEAAVGDLSPTGIEQIPRADAPIEETDNCSPINLSQQLSNEADPILEKKAAKTDPACNFESMVPTHQPLTANVELLNSGSLNSALPPRCAANSTLCHAF
jgi:hypothetical protein